MITYYGYTISPNQLETDEGFLICRNVPIARTGDQEYLAGELGLDGSNVITVHRPAEEVFSEATIASFEGKPVTDDHPADLLDAETAQTFSKGHVQNVRRGTSEWADYLIADLHIHDADLIREIRNGKREVSCGYMTEYEPNEDGTYTQRKIRGNHVAVVEEGRAGHVAAIMDSIQTKATTPPERKKMSKKSLWSSLFGAAAEGKSADEISKLALDAAEALKEETPAEEPEKEAPAQDEDYKDRLFEAIDGLGSKIDALCDALIPKQEEKDEDPIEEALKAIEKIAEKKEGEEFEETLEKEGIDEEGEEAKVVPAEQLDEKECSMDAASVKALLTGMRAAIAGIQDEAQRKAVTDALLAAVNSKKANDTKKIAEYLPKAKKQSRENDIDQVQEAYDKMNPHRRKEA